MMKVRMMQVRMTNAAPDAAAGGWFKHRKAGIAASQGELVNREPNSRRRELPRNMYIRGEVSN